MLYLAYQTHADLMVPVRILAQAGLSAFAPWVHLEELKAVRNLTAAYELITRAGLTHERPAYGIDRVRVANGDVAVREEVVAATPFGTLLHFRKDVQTAQPRVLVVAPLSGHFATLLRSLVRTLLSEHDVCITDWHNARNASIVDGRFGFDDYVEHLIRWLEVLGPGTHVVAVCQPCVQVLAAVAVMAQSGSSAQPRSMTLMAGPIDTRINPTKVNELAASRPIDWYPGFVQLAAFMSMNLDRHQRAHIELYQHLADGNLEKAQPTIAFYDEYFAVLDLTAEFYLETVAWVFQEARLARGQLTFRGGRVEPDAIRRTALLTVEGERDDICALGQTAAAHDLCRGLRPYMKRHHMQAGVGHYGVFSGTRWEKNVCPQVRNMMLSND